MEGAHSPEVTEARKWADNFRPLERHNYDWVYDLAATRYQKLRDTAKNLDDKAASIATAIGGGTGIFTLGSVAALASGTVNSWIVASGLVSVFYAIAAIRSSIMVRKSAPFPEPPSIVYASQCVADLSDTEPKGNPKAAFIGEWHYVCENMMPILRQKAADLDQAFEHFQCAIFSLMIPIAVGILVSGTSEKKPNDLKTLPPAIQKAS